MGIFKNLLGGCCSSSKENQAKHTQTESLQFQTESCCKSKVNSSANTSHEADKGHSPEQLSPANINFSFQVKGMTCGNCIKHVREALQNYAEVKKVDVELGGEEPSSIDVICAISDSASDVSDNHVEKLKISLVDAIEDTGYTVVSAKATK